MIVQSCMDERNIIVHTFDEALKTMQDWWKVDYPDEVAPPVDYLQAYFCCKDDNGECRCDEMRKFLKTPREV